MLEKFLELQSDVYAVLLNRDIKKYDVATLNEDDITLAENMNMTVLIPFLREAKLIQAVTVYWNSAVDMLERFLQLQPADYAVLLNTDIRSKKRCCNIE